MGKVLIFTDTDKKEYQTFPETSDRPHIIIDSSEDKETYSKIFQDDLWEVVDNKIRFYSDQERADALAERAIEKKMAEIDAKRIQEYGPIGDQLDEIYHNFEAWRTRIAEIKAKNPKK